MRPIRASPGNRIFAHLLSLRCRTHSRWIFRRLFFCAEIRTILCDFSKNYRPLLNLIFEFDAYCA